MSTENSKELIPNVLLIGVQKAGTTSLFDWISQHPQVLSNSAVKDFPFFWYDKNYEQGIGVLARYFPVKHNETVVLAGNVNDIFFKQSAERIKLLNPDMRLIVCLRNPVERAYSAYNYAVQRGLENRTFSAAIMQELVGDLPEDLVSQSQKYYVAHGQYWTQLSRFLTYFDRAKIHVVLFEDFRTNPLQVMQGIFQFLAVDAGFIPRFVKRNKTKGGARFKAFDSTLFKYAFDQPAWYHYIKKLIPANLRFILRVWLNAVNKKKMIMPPPDIYTVTILKDYYREEICHLSLFLGRDLTSWLK